MISIKNLSKSYSDRGSSVSLFSDFNLQIKTNEFLVIFGPTGCGKSTLLNMISGVEKYNAGTIEGVQKTRQIGLVTQNNSLLPWLNVVDNIAFGLKLKKVDMVTRRKRALGILDEMGLSLYADFFPHELSGGLSQLVSFARAVAYNVEIMLMDEPFSALDFLTRNKLQKTVRKLHKSRGLTTVFVTHQVDEALYLSTRIVALAAGKPTRILAELNTNSVVDKNSEQFFALQKDLIGYYDEN